MAAGPFSKKDHLFISTLGAEYAVAQAGGIVAGYFLDKKLGSSPAFLLAGAVLGFILGLYIVIKSANRTEDTAKPTHKE